MDFNKCSRIGCENKNCNNGNVCKSCWSDFIEYMYSKHEKSCVDTNLIPEKLLWADLEFFMTNILKNNLKN